MQVELHFRSDEKPLVIEGAVLARLARAALINLDQLKEKEGSAFPSLDHQARKLAISLGYNSILED